MVLKQAIFPNYFLLPFLYCIAGTLFSSCEWISNRPSFADDYITYQVKKGNHEIENNSNAPFTGSNIHFQAIFDSTCIYENRLPENRFDVNKLMGFSDCSSAHQTNSARFGWNWLDNGLQIYAYVYNNGQRTNQHIGTVKINEASSFYIQTDGNLYRFRLNDMEITMPRHCSGGVGLAYKLLPYFGGDETAPHDILIKIRMLK